MSKPLNRDIVFVGPRASLEEAALAFGAIAGRHLPVLDEGRVLGVVHRSDLEAQGTWVDGEWFHWGHATTVNDLTRLVPQVRLVSQESLNALLDALLDHTAVVAIDEEGRMVDLFTDTDGVQEALSMLDDAKAQGVTGPLPRTIRPQAPAWAAFREMQRCEVRHLVLVDAYEPIGVVSVRDLEAAAVENRRLTVAEVVDGRPAITGSAEITVQDAGKRMVDHGIGCLPLVDADGYLVSVVTRRDLIRAALPSR